MVLLVDANIVLDILLDRKEFVENSSIVWKLCETKKVKGYLSTLTISNLIYVMRKELNPSQIEEIINVLKMIFEIVDLTENDLLKVAKLKWNDFEDAVQSIIAERIQADYIVTRNIKDFLNSNVKAFTPHDIIMAYEL